MGNTHKHTAREAGRARSKFYGAAFYKEKKLDACLRSAIKYVDLLIPPFNPNSVVDVGCGRGSWLKAFKAKGATRLVGYDGTWNTQEDMIDPSIVFHGVDLNEPMSIAGTERFDLALSVEVAEHLKPSSARQLIDSLTQLSDVVVFGAAYSKQGGTNHINEQPPSYWEEIFSSFEYVPYDLFRPIFWGDTQIPFWYQQNTFLYVRKNTPAAQLLMDSGQKPMQNVHFMDCIHPTLYEKKIGIRGLIRQLASIKPLRPLARKVKEFIT